MKKTVIDHCFQLARKKHGPTHPSWGFKSVHYSFIIQNEELIAIGYNRPCDVPKFLGYKTYSMLHSEVDAYRRGKKRLRDGEWEILNIRMTKTGKIEIAAPCECCLNLMVAFGCKQIFFTLPDGSLKRWGFVL